MTGVPAFNAVTLYANSVWNVMKLMNIVLGELRADPTEHSTLGSGTH